MGNAKTPINTRSFLHQSDKGAILTIYVQPKASKNEIVGVYEGSLKIRLNAPPVEGEANKECQKFLSKAFRVPKSNIEIVQGHKTRRKILLFKDVSVQALEHALKEEGI